jgi:hypothetical protein
MTKNYYGIDPGWKKLGLAILKWNEDLEEWPTIHEAFTENMSENTEIRVQGLFNHHVDSIGMERYVSYGSVRSTHTEDITTVIGMIRMHIFSSYPAAKLNMIRAIDWKTKLVQNLHKYFGFDNKFSVLDKDFSMQAAKFIVSNPNIIKTDHEADAVCIAALPIIDAKVARIQSKIKTNKERAPHQYVINL